MIVILTTFESKEDSVKAANFLIDNNLAACIEIFPVTSFYKWKGKKLNPSEISAIIKTEDGYFEKVKQALEKLLPYEIPQIIEVNVENANDSYLKWVKESVR